MFNNIKNIIDGKIVKDCNFKVFNIQKKCEKCQEIIFKELNIINKGINVLNIKKNTITVLCGNKIISNELQIRKNNILKKIKKEVDFNIEDIKITI